jgi:hypothetical protein
MKSDRICWIDSRTIKRGHVLVLDGSLVPFCSKCLDACMRANNALSGFEKEQVRELTALAWTVRYRYRRSGGIHMWLADGPAHVGRRSATLTLFVPERVFSGQACVLLYGRSAAEAWTVRRPFNNLIQKHCCLCLFL